MKKMILILGIILALCIAGKPVWSQCPTPVPLDKSSVSGAWQGAYSSEGQFLSFTLQLREVDGKLQASLNIPEVNAKNVVYKTRVCKGQELHLTHSTGNASIEFIGKPREGGSMSGKVLFRENGNVISQEVFTLKKLEKSL